MNKTVLHVLTVAVALALMASMAGPASAISPQPLPPIKQLQIRGLSPQPEPPDRPSHSGRFNKSRSKSNHKANSPIPQPPPRPGRFGTFNPQTRPLMFNFGISGFNPQPEPPRFKLGNRGFNPQPEPPSPLLGPEGLNRFRPGLGAYPNDPTWGRNL